MLSVFRKYTSTPPVGRRGSGLVILALVGAAVVGITSLSLAKANSVAVSSLKGNSIALQAQQYADAEAQLIKATAYTELSAKAKADIQNSNGFQSEVTLSDEADYSETIKVRTASVKVYRTGENTPRVLLNVTRYSKELVPSGVPIGTVITWPGSSAPTEGGTWLLCNGQSCAAYPALAAIVGSNVPNYQGVFLRGYGSRTNGSITHSSGALGAFQNMAFPEVMNGAFSAVNTTGPAPSGPFKEIGRYADHGLEDNNGYGSGLCRYIQFNLSSVVPTGNELRPVNVAVRYYIKAA